MMFKPDFFDDNKAVYYFSVDREDGDYEFYAISLFENKLSDGDLIKLKKSFERVWNNGLRFGLYEK